MSDATDRFEQEERALVLERFDNADAWRLGQRITALAQEAGHAVAVDIRRPGLVLFRSTAPGVTPDAEIWVLRKSAVVLRLEQSSALAEAWVAEAGIDPVAMGWLDHGFAVTGGSFPIRVRGVGVVAAATVSGLTGQGDHDLVVAGLRAHLAEG